MIIRIDKNLKEIAQEIIKENLTESEWSERESCDWFQKDNIVGGYDKDENAFCFSYYDENNDEYWFQLTMNEVNEINDGEKESVELSRVK